MRSCRDHIGLWACLGWIVLTCLLSSLSSGCSLMFSQTRYHLVCVFLCGGAFGPFFAVTFVAMIRRTRFEPHEKRRKPQASQKARDF